MSSGRSVSGGRGAGGRRGGRAAAALEDPLPRRPGLHIHRELALPLGDRMLDPVPNVLIDNIRWLREVVDNMCGTPLVVESEQVGNMSRLHISFSIPARGVQDYLSTPIGSMPHPMVPIVGVGRPGLIRLTLERTAVKACVSALQDVGYFVPDFSHFRMEQLLADETNVVLTTERLCRSLPQHDMDIFGSTCASMSFRAILNQVVERIGLNYHAGESFTTRDWKHQDKLTFYRPEQPNNPLFDFYSAVCDFPWQAEESALIRALAYFNEVLAWTIGDINYVEYLQLRATRIG